MLSAKDAMQQAIERAQIGDIQAGMLWLGIARELRQGSILATDRPAPETGERNLCRWCRGTIHLSDDSDWVHVDTDDVCCAESPRTSGRIEQDSEGNDLLVLHNNSAENAQALPLFQGGQLEYGKTYGGEPAYGQRTETEVIERMPSEPTPAYEAAGEGLGDTALMVPAGVASPQADSQGPNSECLSCGEPVVWIRGRGWTHDVQGHPHSCKRAAEAVS